MHETKINIIYITGILAGAGFAYLEGLPATAIFKGVLVGVSIVVIHKLILFLIEVHSAKKNGR
jgi:hypothetical protein